MPISNDERPRRRMTQEEQDKVEELVNGLASRLSGVPLSVAGPAVGVVFTELAKAEGMDLGTLTSMVEEFYSFATGTLWEGTD